MNDILVRLIADAKQYFATMDTAEGKMSKFGASADTAGEKFKHLANTASTAVVGAGLAIGAASIKMGMDFETATTQLVTGAGESEAALEDVRKGILAMAGKVGQTPVELAKGLYMIESAGYHGAAGLKVLEASAQGAATGGTDMATVANAVTTAMNDYHAPMDSANQVTSALIATVASGKTHLEDLSNSLGRVLPTASALKVPLASVLGSVAALTNTGMSARLATTDLNAAMVGLAAPSSTASKAMQAFGLSSQQLVSMMQDPQKGVAYAFEVVTEHIAKKFPVGSAAYLAALKEITGGTMGMKVALDLTGGSFKTTQQNVKNISDAYKNGKKDVQGFDKAQKDAKFQLDQLKASGASILTNVGLALLPAVTDVAKWAQGLIGYFKAHPLISKIASDAAIAAFGVALAVKIKNGISAAINAVKSLFGAGKEAVQKAQTQTMITLLETANGWLEKIALSTASSDAELAVADAELAKGGGGGKPSVPKKVIDVVKKVAPTIARSGGVAEVATTVGATALVGAYGLALEKMLMAAGGGKNIATAPDFKKPWGAAGMMQNIQGQVQIQATAGGDFAYISTAQMQTLRDDITKLKAANKGQLNKADYYKVVQALAIADMPNIPQYRSQMANTIASGGTVQVTVK
jgi:TP901 family phage tail tape measure protein